MRTILWLPLLVAAFAGCETTEAKINASNQAAPIAKADGSGESAIALDQVPAAVLAAAEKAVPGFVLAGAECETEGGDKVYDLTGTSGGATYEVEVTAAGKVGEIEKDGDEDGGQDGDDDDHDDDDGDDDGPKG